MNMNTERKNRIVIALVGAAIGMGTTLLVSSRASRSDAVATSPEIIRAKTQIEVADRFRIAVTSAFSVAQKADQDAVQHCTVLAKEKSTTLPELKDDASAGAYATACEGLG